MKINILAGLKVKLLLLVLSIIYVLSFAVTPLWFYSDFYNYNIVRHIYQFSNVFSRSVTRWSFFTLGNGAHSVYIYKYKNTNSQNEYLPELLTPLFYKEQLAITKVITYRKFEAIASGLIINFAHNQKALCQNYEIEKNIKHFYVMISNTDEADTAQSHTRELALFFLNKMPHENAPFSNDEFSNGKQRILIYSFMCPDIPARGNTL